MNSCKLHFIYAAILALVVSIVCQHAPVLPEKTFSRVDSKNFGTLYSREFHSISRSLSLIDYKTEQNTKARFKIRIKAWENTYSGALPDFYIWRPALIIPLKQRYFTEKSAIYAMALAHTSLRGPPSGSLII